VPTVLRQSGPKFEKDGEIKTPKALVHFCEDCGAENAPFLISTGGKLLSYCGWREGRPVCIRPSDLEDSSSPTS
jgi:hypothetical protein